MRVWTIVYDEAEPAALPEVGLLGGAPTVVEVLDLLARLARLGHASVTAAAVGANVPDEGPRPDQ